jgi:arylsulfatase A-like enzyme
MNIVFFLVDDGGFADLATPLTAPTGYSMPRLSELMANGTRIERSYVHNLCSPTRTALLSGRNAYSMGLDHGVITGGHAYGLPVSLPTIADVLSKSKQNYTCRAYGKWDAGYACPAMLPTSRGFDSFVGYLDAAEDYYTHSHGLRFVFPNGTAKSVVGYDWQSMTAGGGGGADFSVKGQYSTNIIGMQAVSDIEKHAATFPDPSSRPPLFLYVATQALHGPLEVPPRYINETECATVPPVSGRQIFCGMAKALDEAIGNVTDALERTGMADNTLFLALGDNGGHSAVGGRNAPLRGEKSSCFEGGFRSSGLLLSSRREGVLPKGPRIVSDMLFHVTDLLPTLATAAGVGLEEVPPSLDGFDQWAAITGTGPSPRTEILLHLDNTPTPAPSAALVRLDGAKIITGIPTWYKAKTGWMGCDATGTGECPTGWIALNGTTEAPPAYNSSLIWTFNVTADPQERHDLTQSNWALTQELLARLAEYNST